MYLRTYILCTLHNTKVVYSTVRICSKNNEKHYVHTSVVRYADNARTHVCTGLFEQEMMQVVGEPRLSEVLVGGGTAVI